MCDRHHVRLIQALSDATGGDILFLISCHDIVRANVRDRYRATLVIHASDLPEGKGWSPLVWQILEGRSDIVVTLFEAVDQVDAGSIWHKETIHIEPHELFDEINEKLFTAELSLMDFAVEHAATIQPQPQTGETTTYYRKRTPLDSRIDPAQSIADQFDLIRVSDPRRYPAFFDLHGKRYTLQLRKVDVVENSKREPA